MSPVPIARLAVAALLFPSLPALAGQIEIDLPAAIDRAHRMSAAAIAAQGSLTVAEGAVTTAELPFLENPEIEAGLGPRLTAAQPIDAEIRIEQRVYRVRNVDLRPA